MCTVSENWQANPHLLLANIAHLYHYGGDEEEQWNVDTGQGQKEIMMIAHLRIWYDDNDDMDTLIMTIIRIKQGNV